MKINQGPAENSCRPSADVLFRSAAQVFANRVLAVVLTGMGQDGLRGCEALADLGAPIMVQDEATSVVWGMPGFVAKAGLADSDSSSLRNRRSHRAPGNGLSATLDAPKSCRAGWHDEPGAGRLRISAAPGQEPTVPSSLIRARNIWRKPVWLRWSANRAALRCRNFWGYCAVRLSMGFIAKFWTR